MIPSGGSSLPIRVGPSFDLKVAARPPRISEADQSLEWVVAVAIGLRREGCKFEDLKPLPDLTWLGVKKPMDPLMEDVGSESLRHFAPHVLATICRQRRPRNATAD
jgi:hypothetical protein